MPVIWPEDTLRKGFTAASRINWNATELRNRGVDIDFDNLRGFVDRMRESYFDGLDPLYQASASAVNDEVTAQRVTGAPADTHAQVVALRSAMIAFYTAYDSLFDSLTVVTFDIANGHQPATIPLASLSPLASPLDAIIAASAPMA